eukprot:scaffold41615_cov128-Skeletonema_dohrnii-CCMP3373.AAC.2
MISRDSHQVKVLCTSPFRDIIAYITYSVKRMAVQDNGREADRLVDLGPNALNSSEVDLEAADLLEELLMVVAQ